MFKYVLLLTYLSFGLGVANCLEIKPFTSQSEFFVDIEGERKVLFFDEFEKKYGLEYKGIWKWAEYAKPLKINTLDQKKIHIEFYNPSYASIQTWDLNKLGSFKFSFQSSRGNLDLNDQNIKNEFHTLRPRPIFYESGLTHIPTVNIFYLPMSKSYLRSTDEMEAKVNLHFYLNAWSLELADEYIVLKNYCLVKREYGSYGNDCVEEVITTLLSRHLFKNIDQLSFYERCLGQNHKRKSCIIRSMVKEETKKIPEFLFSKAEVESKFELLHFNCIESVGPCLKKVQDEFFTALGLNNYENITAKVTAHRKLNNEESNYFKNCYQERFNLNDCLIETESQAFLKYLKKDLTQKEELLSIFEQEIRDQISKGEHPIFKNVLVAGMKELVPEINWEQKASDIFKRGPEPREAILKFKLIIANHFSSPNYQKFKRSPAGLCTVRCGELEKDFSELLESCR